jgi:hypothetical protein
MIPHLKSVHGKSRRQTKYLPFNLSSLLPVAFTQLGDSVVRAVHRMVPAPAPGPARRANGAPAASSPPPRGSAEDARPRSSLRAEFSASCHSVATASQSRLAAASVARFAFCSASSAKCANSSDLDIARVLAPRLACLGDETRLMRPTLSVARGSRLNSHHPATVAVS